MMNTRKNSWGRWKLLLGTLLVPVLVTSLSVGARADEDDDDDNDDDTWQVVPSDADSDAADRAQEARDRAQEARDRAQEERDRQREERERQREEARQRAEEAREEARQRADEARQRKEEERQRLEEEKQRAKEEKQRAKEELDRTREERERARDEQCKHDDDCDEGGSGAGGGGGRDKKSGRTSAKVTGPVRFSVEVVNADIQVSATSKDTVSISAKGCAPDDLELDGQDDEFEADFSEWGSCEGPVVVLLPAGSSVEVTTVQGSLKLKGQYKEIEASSVAGSIDIDAGDDVQAEAVQGKVRIGSARRVHVESVAGDVEFMTTGTSPIVEVETVNGQVRWTGACGKGCRASIESFNGASTLTLDPKASSFELRFATQTGKFNDGLGTQTTGSGKNVKGYAPVRARFGKAEGTVRVETYQGGLELKKRP